MSRNKADSRVDKAILIEGWADGRKPNIRESVPVGVRKLTPTYGAVPFVLFVAIPSCP